MSQKLVNGHLYVFDLTPFVITEDTNASVIFVQNECLDGYKELNASLADKMKGFNQFLLCVNKAEWSQEPDPKPEPVSPELAWSAESVTVSENDPDPQFPTLSNPHDVTVSYSSTNSEIASIDASTGAITIVGHGSVTISAAFAGDEEYTAQTVSYALLVEAVTPAAYTVSFDGDLGAVENGFTDGDGEHFDGIVEYSPASTITINFNGDGSLISISAQEETSGDTIQLTEAQDPDTGAYSWTFTMPNDNVALHAEWTSTAYDIYLSGDAYDPQDPPEGIKEKWDFAPRPEGESIVITQETISNPLSVSGVDHTSQMETLQVEAFYDTENGHQDIYAVMINDDVDLEINFAPYVEITYDIQNYEAEVQLFQGGGGSSEGDSEGGSSGAGGNVPDAMFVDGAYEEVASTWRFESNGEHVVKYIFEDGCKDVNFTSGDAQSETISANIEYINSDVFQTTAAPQTYWAITPPEIIDTGSIYSNSQPIYVPADSVTDYQTAPTWSDYAQYISAISD